jgi:hypothetical protein
MSTPDISLGTKLYNAATLSNFGTLASLGFGIYGGIDSEQKWAGVNKKLDDILKGQELIRERIDNVYAEVQDSKLLTATIKFENAIDGWFRTYVALIERRLDGISNPLRSDTWEKELKDDTAELVGDLVKCDDHLREIHAAFMGNLSSLGKPYMDAFVNEVMNMGARLPRTQSNYFYGLSRFERWLILQQKGILLLGNRYKYKNPEANIKTILHALKHATHEKDKNGNEVCKLKSQAAFSAPYLKNVERYYQEFNKESRPDTDFICIGISSCDTEDVFYVDNHPVVSDPGKIVVGLQFYRKGDRVALKIIQAAFNNGFVDQDNSTTKANDNTSDSVPALVNKDRVKSLIKYYGRNKRSSIESDVLKQEQVYVDLSSAEAPSREIMTGAKLYLRGNWICIAIQAAKLNAKLTDIVESTRHWIDARGPLGKAQENTDFYTIRGTAKYINIHPLTPKPLAPLRGAKLLRHFTGDDHRLNLALKTGLCDIEDIWEKYDITTLTGGAKLLADGFKGKVSLKDSRGLFVDNIGFSLPRDYQFELTYTGSDKIRFGFGDGQTLGLDYQDGFSQSKGPNSEFGWLPMENGSIVLLGNNGKFLGRRGSETEGVFVADQVSEMTAERFQLVAS